MPSRYLLQIVDRDSGEVVKFPPGSPVEVELVEDVVKRLRESAATHPSYDQFIESATQIIVARGVGVGRTEAHVAQDIRDGLRQALMASVVDPMQSGSREMEVTVRAALEQSILALKKRIRP